MTKIKKYGLVAALVLPTIFTATNKAEASKAVKNSDKAAAVNVRSEAKEANNIIGLIDNDKAYEVIDNQNGWLKIKYDDKEAYVGSYWFNVVEEAKVINPANFRKDDHLESEVYQVLKKDDVVEVISYANNGFVKVVFEGKEGYIHESLLDLPESFANANKPQVVVANNNYTQETSYQAPAQNYQSSNQTHYEAPAQTHYEAPAQNYQGSSSSAKEIIAQRESGGSYNARNGQYIGRYQLSSSYLNGDYSAANQERVADQYVAQRYGSWDNALAFWNNNGWY
ncbi:SH3 domain-containing protein [Anaerococcus porci]|uniref:aggregation-promoting factor n=1 Tax=Anaerococcus porci TaxID=2652269 RepID=UPI002A75A60A|nr:SH3 domain-containing protein [Anaerococcus porci]MDY3005782.1 SH3 domain-containing protein [Anaerococcus porci]